MAIYATRPESGFYPNLFRTSTALHQITAANRDRLHALGPWTGDNESAARRRLRLLQRPPQASTRHSDRRAERGGRDEHVDARMPLYTQSENGDADACGRAAGGW